MSWTMPSSFRAPPGGRPRAAAYAGVLQQVGIDVAAVRSAAHAGVDDQLLDHLYRLVRSIGDHLGVYRGPHPGPPDALRRRQAVRADVAIPTRRPLQGSVA